MNGRGLYASTKILRRGAFLNADNSHLNMHMHTYQWEALNEYIDNYPDVHMLYIVLRYFFPSIWLCKWKLRVKWMDCFYFKYEYVHYESRLCGRKPKCSRHWPRHRPLGRTYIVFSPWRQETVSQRHHNCNKKYHGWRRNSDGLFRLLPRIKYTELLESFCSSGEGLVTVDYEDEYGKELWIPWLLEYDIVMPKIWYCFYGIFVQRPPYFTYNSATANKHTKRY